MDSIATDTRGGFDAFIAGQRAAAHDSGRDVRVTLAQFDHEYERVYSDVPVADVPPLALSPRGMTALWDGIGRLGAETGRDLEATAESDRPGRVLFVIMTDGFENSSREWTRDSVKKFIAQQERDYSWTFVFLGANIDAVETAASVGIARGQSMTYAARGVETRATFDALSRATSTYMDAPDSAVAFAFTESDRTAAIGDSNSDREQ